MRGVANEEVNVLSPDRLGYKDRGIVKWQGLILSDHVEALKREKENSRKTHPIDAEQTEEVVGEQLYLSLVQKKWVSIQENILKGSTYTEPIVGVVVGFKEETAYVQTASGQRSVFLSDIRHVKPYAYNKWQSV